MIEPSKRTRGAEPVSILILIAILCSTQLVQNWRISRVFSHKDKAKIEQLASQLTAQEKTRAEAEAAKATLETQQAL